jgi:hypothetical protein
MSTTQKEIQIGCETWAYEIEGSYTHVTDTDGEPAFTLRWAATENEITAAAYGYGAGLRAGEKWGREQQQLDILKAIGLSNVSSQLRRPEDE